MANKILIIEDNREFSELLGYTFLGGEFKVEYAFNGAEGLQKLASFKPDLIILDANMPIMDGFQFLEVMRTLPKLNKTPVIMCTEKKLLGDYEKAFDFDVIEYISKPFSREELLKKVYDTLK